MTLAEEKELVRLARDDTAEGAAAFMRLVESARPLLWKICRGFSQADAEDMVQETIARIWAKRRTFRGEARWYAWAGQIAKNNCRIRYRRGKLASFQELGAYDAGRFVDPDAALRLGELVDRAELTALETETLRLWASGMTAPEIARMLGISLAAAKTRVFRVTRRLAAVEHHAGRRKAAGA